MVDIKTIKIGDVVRFTDEACKKFKSRKWQKEHKAFWNDLEKVLPINKFEVQGFTDYDILNYEKSVHLAGIYRWWIKEEEIELVPEEELKLENCVWLRGNYQQYKENIESFKKALKGEAKIMLDTYFVRKGE